MIRKTGVTGIIISFVLISCSTLSKNAGFDKPENKKTLFSDMYTHYDGRPDTYWLGPVKINNHESIAVQVTSFNQSSTTYLIGYFVPFIPIFFLSWMDPDFEPKILKDENLKIRCSVGFDPGSRYKEPIKGKPNAYRITQDGYKYLKDRRQEKADICVDFKIRLTDGRVLPGRLLDDVKEIYEFDVKALDVEAFEFEVPQVQLADGKYIKVDLRGKYQAFNLFQYKL